MQKLLNKEIVRQHTESGLRAVEIAALLGVSSATVIRACDAYGLSRPVTKTKAVLEANKLLAAVEAGLTTDEIATKHGCDRCTVLRSCARLGIPKPQLPPQNRARQRRFDTRFFQQLDTEAKAYTLGFIAADGGRDRNWGIKISLHPRDVDILEKIAAEMRCDYRPARVESGKRVKLGLYDIDMVSDLERYGIVERKTRTIEFAKNVPAHLVIHYMRGVFDGDGTVGLRAVRMVTGSEAFYAGLMRWFESTYGSVPWSQCEGGTKWRIVFSWVKHRQFIDDMYKDAVISLDRKRNNYFAKVLQ